MSLINDALKRAKEAQNEPQSQAQTQQRKVSEPAMRPVEARPQPTSSAVYILSAALVFVLLGAVALFWMWSNSRQPGVVAQTITPVDLAKTNATPLVPIAKPVEIAASVPPPVAVASAPAVVANETPQPPIVAAENSPTLIKEPTPAPEPVAPAVPQFPTLKLQGIFYNSVKPAVLINGKTYSIGGVVSGVQITKIESDKVTVKWNDEIRVLETAQ
ncbi:MAG: hypothetical protein H0X66_04945 [Verrucomicrobia bacterium]|nr:hypothetical protein [Verrucomicrobiota bacterium]